MRVCGWVERVPRLGQSLVLVGYSFSTFLAIAYSQSRNKYDRKRDALVMDAIGFVFMEISTISSY